MGHLLVELRTAGMLLGASFVLWLEWGAWVGPEYWATDSRVVSVEAGVLRA